MSHLSYIEPAELERLVLARSETPHFLVIDVRSSDFVGGNIPNALNLTTDKFSSPSKTERTIERYISPLVERQNLSLVVVHCMRSQTRGPYVAHQLKRSDTLSKLGVDVKVLRGGFQGWYRTFEGRKELFENLGDRDQDEWEDVVNANEGDEREAQDSKELREKLARE